jgi:L-ascorbate metabolism protein UlaG (beta-lactamase superfamily)
VAAQTLTERSTKVAGLIAHSWERYQQDRARPILAAAFHPDPAMWGDHGLFAAWLGHSTALLKIDGVTIVTDPVLGDRIGLNLGPMTVGLKRMVALPLAQARIPQPDIILLSHAHMDHFDVSSLRSLESNRSRVVTAAQTSDLLRVPNYRSADELAWGEEVRIGELTIRAVEVRHWGARMHSDTFRGYNGYLIETPRYRVLFGGDTALTDSFSSLRDSRGIDLALMPIGSYNPFIGAHCNPEQALQMANDAGAEFILPIHHRTFQLGYEPYDEPIERLTQALASDSHRLVTTQIGQEFRLPS